MDCAVDPIRLQHNGRRGCRQHWPRPVQNRMRTEALSSGCRPVRSSVKAARDAGLVAPTPHIRRDNRSRLVTLRRYSGPVLVERVLPGAPAAGRFPLFWFQPHSPRTKSPAPSMIATSAMLNTPVRSCPIPKFRKSTTLPRRTRSIQFEAPPAVKRTSPSSADPGVLPSEGQHQQCDQRGPCRDLEDGISRDGRQVGPKTQKPASILDVADTYRVRQERPIPSAGEIRRSGVLGDPVAADCSKGSNDQKECSGPRQGAGHTPV